MTNNEQLKSFVAKQIRHLRLEKGFTQEHLAEKANLGFNYIYRLENKQLNVKIDTVEKIMQALEIDLNTFFNIETQQREPEFNQLIDDIEHLPKEKREPTIKALRSIVNQIK